MHSSMSSLRQSHKRCMKTILQFATLHGQQQQRKVQERFVAVSTSTTTIRLNRTSSIAHQPTNDQSRPLSSKPSSVLVGRHLRFSTQASLEKEVDAKNQKKKVSDSSKHHPRSPPQTPPPVVAPKYAAVDHGMAYQAAMEGLHGKQLALAAVEGYGKDDPPFDPFLEDEMLENEETEYDEDDYEEGIDSIEGKEDADGKQDTDELKEEQESDETDDDDDDEIDEEEDESDWPSSIYNKDGSLRRTKSELAVLRAGAPAGGMAAIIKMAGSQFKVTTDDLLVVNRLKPVDVYSVGSTHTLRDEDVLLVSSTHLTLVGMPYIAGAEVDFMVEEITKDKKVIIFKKRRRKHSQRKRGFRRDITMIRILDIRPPSLYAGHTHMPRLMPTPAVLDE